MSTTPFIGDVISTGEKFISGVVDTRDNFRLFGYF
jgi:hypothetical protein